MKKTNAAEPPAHPLSKCRSQLYYLQTQKRAERKAAESAAEAARRSLWKRTFRELVRRFDERRAGQ